MNEILVGIPNICKEPLNFVFEDMKLPHKPNTLWLEFGVYSGNTINYISQFSNETVYGFDSFKGLPDFWRDGFGVGTFNRDGNLPTVNNNVELVVGWFNESLPIFLQEHPEQLVSFIHMDADLYSSTKYIFDALKHRMDTDCVIVFDELVNYNGYDGETGELKAFYEFVTENHVSYSWIGMNGKIGDYHHPSEKVAVQIHSIKKNS